MTGATSPPARRGVRCHTPNAAPVPRIALSIREASAALGVSEDYFAAHVAPELRIVRKGRRKLVGVAELERWIEENGERVLE